MALLIGLYGGHLVTRWHARRKLRHKVKAAFYAGMDYQKTEPQMRLPVETHLQHWMVAHRVIQP